MNTAKNYLSFSLIFLFLQCSDDTQRTTPNGELLVSFRAETQKYAFESPENSFEGLLFTEVMIGMTELELADESNGGEVPGAEIEGNFLLDLINQSSIPEIPVIKVPAGNYSSFDLEMDPVLPGQRTLFISFQYQPAGLQEPLTYEFISNQEIELELFKTDGYDIRANQLNQIQVVIDLDILFSGRSLDEAVLNQEGIVLIDQNNNANIYAAISQSLQESITAGLDPDGDG